MKRTGLTAEQVEESRNKHGSNSLTQIPAEPLWKKILEGFKDPMIMILLVALVVQVVLFFLGQAEWFEPAGILIAIMIANGVASVSESKQEGKASALKVEEEAKETANTEAPREPAMPQVRQRPPVFLSDSCVLLSPERNT